MNRVILVGESPGRNADPERPLDGGVSGGRLADLSGLNREDYLATFVRLNVLGGWHGKDGKGDAFPMAAARESARTLFARAGVEPFWLLSDRVVFLGRRTAHAFCFDVREWFTFKYRNGVVSAIMPHPSGINRWWNDEDNVERARWFMRNLASFVSEGTS